MLNKIIVGVSGGVDSSVAAMLLKRQGYDVEAMFMKNWNEKSPDGSCFWETDVEDAMMVCDKLDIPLNTVDLSLKYWQKVFTNFLEEYEIGRTPNPDILCNQEVKFKAFLDHVLELGADKIATGHYARIDASNNQYNLLKGVDGNKDQSYFLCRLTQSQLERSMFPIGEIEKPKVRRLATEAGLITHDKKDSTGICFIGERPFRDFLSQYIPIKTGSICTLDGKVIGEHQGVQFYTLGQRQDLGIGGVKGAKDGPWYVISKDIESNTLIVSQGHDHPLLLSRGLTAVNLRWINGKTLKTPFLCKAKTRYRQVDQQCTIQSLDGDTGIIHFENKQRAATPGQYIVFYADDVCLGGGVIDSVLDQKQLI